MKCKTTQEFIDDINKLTNGEYILLGEYINNKTKVKMLHTKCNKEYLVMPNKFLYGTRCPYCSHPHNKKTTEEFKKEIYNLVGKDYILLDEYINNKTKVKMLHTKCNKEYLVTPTRFLSGTRCPYCNKDKYRKTQEEFEKEIYNLVGNEYIVKGKYINSKTKIKMLHTKCNKEYYYNPSMFINKKSIRCPYCRRSKGEERISKWLDNNNILYETQYSFPDCKYKKKLKFDFKLKDSSGKIILIEYDGIQHYKKLKYNNELEIQKKRDEIKNNYCRDRGIDLYRISYKDFDNIESILEEIINKYE